MLGTRSSEREVFRVLWNHRRKPLVRSEIHRSIPAVKRPTLGRVGQILKVFREEGFLDSEERRAQGSQSASFYSLSEDGVRHCRVIGFGSDEGDLFPLDPEIEKRYVNLDLIATPASRLGTVTAFHAHRGGLGRSTMVWHCAKGIAESGRTSLLVADFDLDAPGLDAFFATQGLGRSGGLRRLIADFYAVADKNRPSWLRKALTEPEYVVVPSQEQPQIYYLPSGFSPGCAAGHERREVLDHLWAEIGVWAEHREDPHATDGYFLTELRRAIPQVFPRALLDSQKGLSLGAWAAVAGLADELVICQRYGDSTTDGVRAVLANFLRHCSDRGAGPGRVVFAFAPSRAPIDHNQALSWVRKYIFGETPHLGLRSDRLQIVAVKHSARGERGLVKSQPFYEAITSLTNGNVKKKNEMKLPMGVRLYVETIASELPSADPSGRSILKGSVASFLAEKSLALKILDSEVETELEKDILDVAGRTEKVMNMKDIVTVYK